jgi:hypothetical protein
MAQKDTSDPKKENNEEVVKDDLEEERKTKRKARRKQRKEERKSKTTGVGLKISVEGDSALANKKIVFDDSNLPSEEEDNDDSTNDKHKDERSHSKITMEEHDDDDDAVEEVQGKAARDKVMDQMKTEEKQALKTKKKRKRKKRKENNNSDDEEMDDDFFAQLDSVREVESKERKELEKSAARAALKGKHTTFVFAKNEDDDEALSDPVQINENIQVVVLKNKSASEATGTSSFFAPNASISQKALRYSRNRLNDGSDPAAGATEMKRKRNHSGEVVQPWKRARQRLAMGRSRLTKGKPAAFFKTKKR